MRGMFNKLAPVLGCLSLAFGVWYGLSALDVTPYYFSSVGELDVGEPMVPPRTPSLMLDALLAP